MGVPTHHPSGVSNRPQGHWGFSLPMLDPTKLHTYFNDFDRLTIADWIVTTTEAGTGAATEAIANADGGVFVITNDDADNDADFLQLAHETFRFARGKQLWFAARLKVSDATDSDFVMGLQITDTAPLAVTDGVFFQKDDGDALLDFHVTKDSTSSDVTGLVSIADDTFIEVAFHFDGANYIEAYVDGALRTKVELTNMPDDEDLTISFGIQNGAAAAKSMSIDYILVAKER